MALETVNGIKDLVATNPVSATDNPRYIADHVRNIKTALLTDLAGIDGPVTATHTELNYCVGLTSAAQTQLTALTSVAQNTQNADYTLVAGDANKQIYKSNTTAYAWTIPPNSSVAFPTGTTVTFVNAGSAGAITLTRGSGVALILAGDGTDSNKTLAAYGWATAMKVATDTWFISGAGLS